MKNPGNIKPSIQPEKPVIFMCITLIVLLGFAVYSNSLTGAFLWDDNVLVKDNVSIRNWSNLPEIFSKDASAKFGVGIGKKYNFFRPLQLTTYMLDYSLWGSDVRGYHLSNITFHVLVALTIFWLINLLYDSWGLALLTSLFFVVHPIHTEAVSYISGRADPLAALFLLLGFIFYIKYLRAGKFSFCFLSCVSYVFSLLSRENSLIFPFLLLLYHYSFNARFKLRRFLPVASLTAGYVALRCTLLKSLLSETFPTTFLERVPGFFVAIFNYAKLLIVPVNLHMEYGQQIFKFADLRVMAGALILISMLVYVFRIRKNKKDRIILFSIAWFLVALMPSSNLYPLNAYMAEHWLYIPSIGLFLFLAQRITFLYRIENLKIVSIILTVFLLASYSGLTLKQNVYWREPLRLYQLILKYAPDSARVNFNLGNQYHNMGKVAEAIPLYKKAIALDPDYSDAYTNLGLLYYDQGKKEEAIELYEKAIRITPKHSLAYNNLGVAYYDVGKRQEALASYKRAIELNPDDAEVYNNMGIIEYDLGNDEEAIRLYKKAIEKDPAYGRAYSNLSIVYWRQMKHKLAIDYCDRAIEQGFTNAALIKALKPYR